MTVEALSKEKEPTSNGRVPHLWNDLHRLFDDLNYRKDTARNTNNDLCLMTFTHRWVKEKLVT